MDALQETVLKETPVTRFMDWLTEEACGFWNIFGYVVFAALVVVSLDYAVQAALVNWGMIPAPELPKEGETPFQYYNVLMFITMFAWGPVKEEVIFRVLPLSIVIAFVSKRPGMVFGAMTGFAILFGAIHPYALHGRIQVAISGFFFGLVFLKCGGLRKRFVKASICAMGAHGLTNILLVLDAWWEFYELTL